MPTISQQPWTAELILVGNEQGFTAIKDAVGNIIGTFRDGQNADHIIKAASVDLDELENRLEESENENDKYENEEGRLLTRIEILERQLNKTQ